MPNRVLLGVAAILMVAPDLVTNLYALGIAAPTLYLVATALPLALAGGALYQLAPAMLDALTGLSIRRRGSRRRW